MPDAFGPRNDGQLPLAALADRGGNALAVLSNFRTRLATASFAGSHALPSSTIRRSLHSSETSASMTRLPSTLTRYLPGASQPPGPFAIPSTISSISAPFFFQLPVSLGHSWLSTPKPPA